MAMRERLELGRVSVAYGAEIAVRDVTLKLRAGRIGCLLGPLGSGKSSVLRAVAGFVPVTNGAIHIDGAKVCSLKSSLPTELRGVGVVFRDCALFQHLTVGQNVGFGLHKLSRDEAIKRMIESLHRVGLRDLRDLDRRYPHQLSAEQRLRVALARAIAPKPRLLLLDDPFSGLDRDLRERLPLEVRDILKQAEITALLATCDQQDAFSMADEIGVMSAGRLQQWGDVETIYHRPANRFVANYIGQGAILTVKASPGLGISTELGFLPLPDGGASLQSRPYLEILLRPSQVSIQPVGIGNAESANANVVGKIYRGMEVLYTLRLTSGTEIFASAPPDHPYYLGDMVQAKLKPHHPAILYLADQA
jgi:iron(III) transport system ATP-binding protein